MKKSFTIMETRIVLPDGNGESFPGDFPISIGDKLKKAIHKGLNAYVVYRIDQRGDTKFVMVK